MNVQFFSLLRAYEIKCKLFTPDTPQVDHLVLGVHGFAGDRESSMLEKLATQCTSEGGALLCFDFPAHGHSPVKEDMLTAHNCKQDLLAVFRHGEQLYPNAKKSVFATSFGGYITLLCAHELPACPLILRAPAVTMPNLLLKNVLRTTEEHFRQVGVIRCGFERPIHLPFSALEDLREQEDLMAKVLDRQALIIHGDRDDIVPIEDIRQFVSCHHTATLEIIPGADHRFKKPGEMEQILSLTAGFLKG